MDKLFERLISDVSKIYPDIYDELNEGADDSEIQAAQDKLGVKFPSDLIDFYKLHNGLDTDMGIFYGWSFLSIEEVVSEWETWESLVSSNTFEGILSEPDEGIKNDWYNLKWIPIGTDGGGNCICLDLDPDDKGISGQLIDVWHDSPERTVIAYSFKEFIEKFLSELEEGKLVYDEDFGSIDYMWND